MKKSENKEKTSHLFKISYKITILVIAMVVLCSVFVGVFVYRQVAAGFFSHNGQTAQMMASSFASSLNWREIQNILDTEEKNEYYDFVRGSIIEATERMPHLAFVYILSMQEPYFFTIYGRSPGGDISHELGFLFPLEIWNDAAIHAHVAGEHTYSTPYSVAGYGDLVSGYAPIFNESGDVIAIVGVDLSLGEIYAELNLIRNTIALIVAIFVIISSIVAILCTKQLIEKPLTKLSVASNKIASGDVDTTVPIVKTNDEIGLLSRNFNQAKSVLINLTKEIREVEQRGQFMLDVAPLIIQYWNRDYVCIDSNQTTLDFYGFSTKEEYFEKLKYVLPSHQTDGSPSWDKWNAFLRKVLEDGAGHIDFLERDQNGEPAYFEVEGLRAVRNNETVIITYSTDITKSKLQDEKIREIEQKAISRIKQVYDASPIPSSMWSLDLKPLECNQAMVKLLKLEKTEDFINKFAELNPEFQPCGATTAEKIIEVVEETKRNGYCNYEWVFLTTTGEEVLGACVCVLVDLGDEQVLSVYFQDLREAQLMQEEKLRREIAENENLAKSLFLARMSHEIRTPMNAVMGMAELILRENIPEPAREQAEIIKQSGSHLLYVINDILDLSKIESGKLDLVEEEYPTASLINDLVNVIKARLQGREINFILNISSNIPHALKGDSARVYQVIINLLSNAVKYTEKGFVAMDMEGQRDGDKLNLIVRVRDSGKGIKEEDLAGLFKEFVRLDTEANKGIEGTGLGLAITRSLIHHMGGTIEVDSTFGQGSTFTVTLPQIIVNHKNMVSVTSPEEKSIIALERREHCIESIYRTMEDLGVICTVTESFEEFYEALLSGKYAFALLADHLYDSFCEKYPQMPKADTQIVLVNEFNAEVQTKDKGLLMLTTPIYCLSVAPLLNDTLSASPSGRSKVHSFIAPTAKILIVDDVEVNLKVASGLLKPYQMETTLCASGYEAVEAVKQDTFDLVLMDYMMPGMSGIEAVEMIREIDQGADIPIVALTANAIVGAKEVFLETGFDDFLSKPIEMTRLNDIITKWIPRKKQQQTDTVTAAYETKVELEIDGVDITRGLALSGENARLYIDLLVTFSIESAKKHEELTRCFKVGDLPLYTIHVHALKAACANIGAAKVSKEAEELENAGERKDREFIREHHTEFSYNLVKLIANINEALASVEKSEDIEYNEDSVISGLTELKTALENFDISAIDKISKEVQNFSKHPTYGETVREILRLAFVSRYKQAETLITDILNAEKEK
ncbi:MAG: ATP-binding protein [Oscillospiraceae bacterium]|nr:ATP-binding protein [Oscillospiraceae bacterium]